MVDISDGAGPSNLAIAAEESDELRSLVRALREMESMSAEQYRGMTRRLLLQWHPDKNPERQEMATRFFRIIMRHEESYRGDKDFSWLNEASADGAAMVVQSADQEMAAAAAEHSSHPKPRSWADEFLAEQRATEAARTAMAQQQASAQRAYAAEAARSGPFNGGGRAERDAPPREKDNMKADAFWNQVSWWLRGAEVLLNEANEGGVRSRGLYAQSVVCSQQAGEFAIKSLMFRTCGITKQELKGPKAHHLDEMVSNITRTGMELPVALLDLRWLSLSYIYARYPLDESNQTPADKYGRAEADKALQIAALTQGLGGTDGRGANSTRCRRRADASAATHAATHTALRTSAGADSHDARAAIPLAAIPASSATLCPAARAAVRARAESSRLLYRGRRWPRRRHPLLQCGECVSKRASRERPRARASEAAARVVLILSKVV